MAAKPYYWLYDANGAAAPLKYGVDGGDYCWRCEATAWNGATAKLRYLKLDGATYTDVLDSSSAAVTLTADGQKNIGIAQGAILAVQITGGTPTGFKSVLAGLGD